MRIAAGLDIGLHHFAAGSSHCYAEIGFGIAADGIGLATAGMAEGSELGTSDSDASRFGAFHFEPSHLEAWVLGAWVLGAWVLGAWALGAWLLGALALALEDAVDVAFGPEIDLAGDDKHSGTAGIQQRCPACYSLERRIAAGGEPRKEPRT